MMSGNVREAGMQTGRVSADRHGANGHGTGSRRASAWFALLLVLAGAAVMSYPMVSNWLAEQNASRAISDYDSVVAEYSEEELAAAWEAAERYNESLAGDPVHDPFVPGSGYALPENYEQVLDIAGDGVMGYLEIPKIRVSLPIYHGTSDEVLERGVGHIEQTALPVGGEGRHAVLTGHRGLPSAELFTRLDELGEGDEFYITVLGKTLAYRVESVETVLPDELSALAAEPGRDLVTLVTCTPYAVNTHRLLVHGVRTEYNPDDENDGAIETTAWQPTPYQVGLAIGGGALVLTGTMAAARRRRRARRAEWRHVRK